MTPTLLTILTDNDIDWMRTVGQQQEIKPHTVVLEQEQPVDTLMILIEGRVGLEIPPSLSSDQPVVLQRSPGTMFGSLPEIDGWTLPAIARTLTPARILSVPTAALCDKIQYDSMFAAHLYSAIAHLLTQQLNDLSQLATDDAPLYPLQLRDASTVFAELQDYDLDWLVSVGTVQSLKAKERLLHSGVPIDALHVILEGGVALGIPTERRSPLFHAFNPYACGDVIEIARRSRGDVIGEFLLVRDEVSMFTVETLRETQILSVPRWRLVTKLLYDPEFAARIYRMLVALLSSKQQEILKHLGLSAAIQEANHTMLNRMAIAEARFEWMVKRIQSQTTEERTRLW